MAAISLRLKPQLRYLSALILGVLISLGLFFLMQSLIDSGEQNKNASSEGQIMEFIRIREDETLSIKDRRKPQKPKPPKEPPPPPKLIVEKQVKPTMNRIKIEIPNIDLPSLAGGGPFLGNWAGNPLAEGDVLPIVRIDPQWPREALIEGIEGYVVVEVTIGIEFDFLQFIFGIVDKYLLHAEVATPANTSKDCENESEFKSFGKSAHDLNHDDAR